MVRKKNRKPTIGKAPTERHNVTLPPEYAEFLRVAGGGNLSAGIRLAADALERETMKKRR